MVEYGGISTFPENKATGQKTGHGCWFWGCLTAGVIFLVVVVGGYFGVRHLFRQAVIDYSTTEALSIPIQTLSEEQYAAAKSRVEDFLRGLDGQGGADSLVLTSDDINALIAYHPSLMQLKNRIFVDLRSNDVHGRVSIPLDFFGFPERFLNAEGKFSIALRQGRLVVNPTELTFNGRQIPEQFLQELQKEDMTEHLFKENSESRDFFEKLENISIIEGKVVLKRKGSSPEQVGTGV